MLAPGTISVAVEGDPVYYQPHEHRIAAFIAKLPRGTIGRVRFSDDDGALVFQECNAIAAPIQRIP